MTLYYIDRQQILSFEGELTWQPGRNPSESPFPGGFFLAWFLGLIAQNPNSRSARPVSRQRRGCLLGFAVFHVMFPRKLVIAATLIARSRMEMFVPLPRLTGADL